MSLPEHCEWCPFVGCSECAYKGGETVRTTPTGTPVLLCGLCDRAHSVNVGHCRGCGRASLFIRPDGCCIHCETVTAQRDSGARVCENGAGNDERPAAPTADRSSHSDSPTRKGGMAQW